MSTTVTANMPSATPETLDATLTKLSITDSTPTAVKRASNPSNPNTMTSKATTEVADSWDDDLSSDSETETESSRPTSTVSPKAVLESATPASIAAIKTDNPKAPPPTPISPPASPFSSSPRQNITTPLANGYGNPASTSSYGYPSPPTSGRDPNKRPEKSTAVASRLIAGALGVRAPKRTEEQRAYDRAVKEQEMKKRNREKEEAAKKAAEEEKNRAAVWEN